MEMLELLLRSRKFIAGSVVVVAIIMCGIVGSIITSEASARIDPSKVGEGLPPSWEHPLGTTTFGQDVFAVLCRGIRNSLMVGLLGGSLGTLIAVLLGAFGPYKGSWADELSNFVTNVVLVFPVLSTLLFLSFLLRQRSLLLVACLIALTTWPWAARCIRSQVLSLKEREFTNLAKMSGMGSLEVALTEVLPNMLAYIIMVFVLLAGGAIIAEAGISAIGLGPDYFLVPTLGNTIQTCVAQPMIHGHWSNIWWWFIPPGLVLTVLLSAIFVMHAGMDEVFNPRLRRV
ncbi:MAG: ABC transporter permease [Candidatus Bathyarchaeia archaeon]